ncbi:hypothetical protein [Algoriphagus machipongonensis]|uniref:hypothetical protein n=1 Tax=Algoriphagus machipongonensis TaxID=388413 RepID=UPI001292F829|nr:hypothetical protein [Algoriphagus machipongonensis]
MRSSNTSHASIRDPCYLWSQFPVSLVSAPAPYYNRVPNYWTHTVLRGLELFDGLDPMVSATD